MKKAKKALESHRLDSKALSVSNEILFQNLGLTDGKYLKSGGAVICRKSGNVDTGSVH